jgi:hypothetical protein
MTYPIAGAAKIEPITHHSNMVHIFIASLLSLRPKSGKDEGLEVS